jgi:hypothetical protein
VQLEVRALRREFDAIEAETGLLTREQSLVLPVESNEKVRLPQVDVAMLYLSPTKCVLLQLQAIVDEAAAIRAEFDAIEREARHLALVHSTRSSSSPCEKAGLSREVRAIRTEFEVISRESHQAIAALQASTRTSNLQLNQKVTAIRAEFDAIERQAHQLAALVRRACLAAERPTLVTVHCGSHLVFLVRVCRGRQRSSRCARFERSTPPSPSPPNLCSLTWYARALPQTL